MFCSLLVQHCFIKTGQLWNKVTRNWLINMSTFPLQGTKSQFNISNNLYLLTHCSFTETSLLRCSCSRSVSISPCSGTPLEHTQSCYFQRSCSSTYSPYWSTSQVVFPWPPPSIFLAYTLHKFISPILMPCPNHLHASHFTRSTTPHSTLFSVPPTPNHSYALSLNKIK